MTAIKARFGSALRLSFTALILGMILGAAAHAASELALEPKSRLWLSGTSTLHPYASTSTRTQLVAELAPDTAAAPIGAVLLDVARRAPFQQFQMIVPAAGLKSGESGLDKNLLKALKAEKFPDIRYTLAHYEASPAAADGSISFHAAGRLSIAGVQKDIVIDGTGRLVSDGLVMAGQYLLVMSDYGIKPPTLLLGAIKVADPVVIHFDLHLKLTKGVSP